MTYISQSKKPFGDSNVGGLMMEKCKWCGVKTGYTQFIGMVDGHLEALCKTCFFQHVNGGRDTDPSEKIGSLNYEVLSKLFILD